MALLAALVLISMVGMVAAAVLQSTSTEVAISGYHKRAVQGLYAAEAGLAEAQVRLTKHPGAESYFIGDPLAGYSAQWVAYLIATPNWAVQNDPTFSSQETRYFPLAQNPVNTVAGLNSVQSFLSYWVKIQHKTERDAERDGHHTSHPHYVDGDGSFSRHRGTNKGRVLYFGYLATGSSQPVQFTTSGQTPYLPVERVTAYSVGKGQRTRIQVDMVHYPGPPHLAAVVGQNGVILSGEQGVINGQDACGVVPGLPPVASGQAVQLAPMFQLEGTSSGPHLVTHNLDLPRMVSGLQPDAILVTENQRGRVWGSPSLPKTVFAQSENFSHPDGLRLDQVSGHGILAVHGRVRIQGPVSWDGLMIVSGTLVFDAPGSAMTIRGGVWAGEVEARQGVLNVQYNSCAIKSALLARPMIVRNWKELF